jgi:flagellar hook-associated protein 2
MSDTSSIGSTSSTSSASTPSLTNLSGVGGSNSTTSANTNSSTASTGYTSSISQQIDQLVSQFTTSESQEKVTPLQNQVTKYQNLTNAYSSLSTALTNLQTISKTLQATDQNDIFGSQICTSSDSSFVTATATSAASSSGYQMRVNQLAQSDVLVSQDETSASSCSLTGTHTFNVTCGGGTNGTYSGQVSVTFGASETNQTAMQKIANAINQSQAVVTSTPVTGTDEYTGGPSTFSINLNGTTQNITVNGGGTYDDLLNEMVSNITAKVTGVTAAKLTNTPATGQEELQLTVNTPKDYISIASGTGNDLVTSLGIAETNLKSAAGMVTASVFSPTTTTSQLSLTAASTGLDYRIENLSDASGSSALSTFGLNVGTTRPTFSQTTEPNTPGFIYPDITTDGNELNAKIEFNSLNIQRDSNAISDLATGVTFNLQSVMQTTDTTCNITVATDEATIESNIKSFITNFNAVYTNIKNNQDQGGIFVGDYNASSIMTALNTNSYKAISGIAKGDLNTLGELGISLDPTSGLVIKDESQLKTAITNTATQVGAIFNSTGGIANTMYNLVSPYIGAGGYLAKATQVYNKDITNLNTQITTQQNNITKQGDALRQEYVGLQTSLAAMQSQYAIFGFGNSSSATSLFGA